MRRLGLAALAVAVATSAAFYASSAIEPDLRYRRIDGLLAHYEGRGYGEWSSADATTLWDQVTWFQARDPRGLVRRVLEALDSDDPDARFRALLLAAHVEIYQRMNLGTMVFMSPHLLPLPSPQSHRLDGFQLRSELERAPAAFVLAAEDPRADARLCFVWLADPQMSDPIREAFLRVAEREEEPEIRSNAIVALVRTTDDPTVASFFRRLMSAGTVDERPLAACALAMDSDPEGTRVYVEILTDLHNDASPLWRHVTLAWFATRFPSLEPLRDESVCGWPEDARRGWRTWLEIREHEGYRPDAQAARDAAVERE